MDSSSTFFSSWQMTFSLGWFISFVEFAYDKLWMKSDYENQYILWYIVAFNTCFSSTWRTLVISRVVLVIIDYWAYFLDEKVMTQTLSPFEKEASCFQGTFLVSWWLCLVKQSVFHAVRQLMSYWGILWNDRRFTTPTKNFSSKNA